MVSIPDICASGVSSIPDEDYNFLKVFKKFILPFLFMICSAKYDVWPKLLIGRRVKYLLTCWLCLYSYSSKGFGRSAK